MDDSTLFAVRQKVDAALDGQAGPEMLTWGCALVAARLPEPKSAYPFEAAANHGATDLPQLDLLPWDEEHLESPDWEEQVRSELEPGTLEPLQPTLPRGAPAIEETVRWGWQVITMGGEQVWLTPAHLLALEAAKPKLYGVDGWLPSLGFRSSPTSYQPVSDFYVVRACCPPVRLVSTAYYVSEEYHHASRSSQHIVLAFRQKPAGLPW